MATEIIRPISDYYIGKMWENSDLTTTNLYSYIDEEDLSSVDYIKSTILAGDNDEVLFSFSQILNNTKKINSISFRGRIYSSDSDLVNYIVIKIGLSEYEIPADRSDNWSIHPTFIYNNPSNDEPWTVSDINNAKFGVKSYNVGSKDQTMQINQLYIEVDYDEEIVSSSKFFQLF